MAKIDHTSIENRIAVCKEYSALWLRFFGYWQDSLEDRQITEQMEAEFLQVLSVLALNHYKFEELVGDVMPEARKVLDVLCEVISLANLKSLPEAQFTKLQVDWHTLFISMNKALGKLILKLPPKKLAELQASQQASS
jgi:hypothetical protein